MTHVKAITVCALSALNFLVLPYRGGSLAEAPSSVTYVCAGVWGWRGSDDGDFLNPAGIAVASDGKVYVVDNSNYRIQYFTPAGSFLGKWGTKGDGPGEFVSPGGIAISPQGDLYVADVEAKRIQRFTSNGSYVLQWLFNADEPVLRYTINGTEYENYYDLPAAVAVSAEGNVYVIGNVSDQVFEYTPNGSLIRKWGDTSYWGPGEPGWYEGAPGPAGNFWDANGIAVSPNGDIYVADTGYHRVQYFSSAGSFKGMWGREGFESGEFKYPRGLTVSPDGDVYVTDNGNARVQLFSASGSFITNWGVKGYGWGEFAGVRDIAIGPDGTVYATEKDADRVQFFNRTSNENDR